MLDIVIGSKNTNTEKLKKRVYFWKIKMRNSYFVKEFRVFQELW